MEASPELTRVLLQRMRISERGSPSSMLDTAFSFPERQQQQKQHAPTSRSLLHPRGFGAPPPNAARRPLSSPGQAGNRSSPNSVGASPHGSKHLSHMQQKVQQLEARNAQLEKEAEALRGRLNQSQEEMEVLKGTRDQNEEDLLCGMSQDRAKLAGLTEQILTQQDRFLMMKQHSFTEQQHELNTQFSEVRKAQAAMQAEAAENETTIRELREDKARLQRDNESLRAAQEEARQRPPEPGTPTAEPPESSPMSLAPSFVASTGTSSCSGCRLRAAMVSQTGAPEELRSAITAVEALLEEARRELERKEFRRRRAAFERLHDAMDKQAEEEPLEAAIAAARVAGVHAEDIEAAEKKLADLRALTPEEKARRALRELEAKRKKEAYFLVKKDNAEGLAAFLDSLEEGLEWHSWKDYAGRTLRRCAQELRAAKAEAVLVERTRAIEALTRSSPPRPHHGGLFGAGRMMRARSRSSSSDGEAAMDEKPSEPAAPSAAAAAPTPAAAPTLGSSAAASVGPAVAPATSAAAAAPTSVAVAAVAAEPETTPEVVAQEAAAVAGGAPTTPRGAGAESRPEVEAPSPEEADKLKARALRAVVQDDCGALSEVLESVPLEIWSKWQNRAGKDLLTLSQERGSSSAYSMLAYALGMVKEVKRDIFEERETVWVFVPGDVQPRRATVLEDTPEEADTILVEYWDGDDEPEHVDRCTVRKMWS